MSNAPHVPIDPAAFWRDPYRELALMRREHRIAYVPQLGVTLFISLWHRKRFRVFAGAVCLVVMAHTPLDDGADRAMLDRCD